MARSRQTHWEPSFVEAECGALGCPFGETKQFPVGDCKPLLRAARAHVRETGHTVHFSRTEEMSIALDEPAESGSPRETQ